METQPAWNSRSGPRRSRRFPHKVRPPEFAKTALSPSRRFAATWRLLLNSMLGLLAASARGMGLVGGFHPCLFSCR